MPSPAKLLASASGITPDPNFRNVTLLLHGDGSNGAQNNTFLDSSSNNFTITRNGNTTQGSFNPYGTRWSNYFDGTGDYLSIADNAAFDVGSGNFTVEAWVWNNGSSTTSWVFGQTSSSFTASSTAVGLSVNSSGFPNGAVAVGSSFTNTASSVAIARNSWNHIAFVRDGATLRMFVNGTQTATSNISTNTVNNSTTPVGIGRIGDYNLEYWNGYISDFRFVKGTAVYTANFTPPTAPLTAISGTSLLTCQSNRFRDASTNNFAITRNGDVKVTNFAPFAPSSSYSTTTNGGSAFFDGTGDYLTVADNTALQMSGSFTWEAWIYLRSFPSSGVEVFWSQRASSGGFGGPLVAVDSSGNLSLYIADASASTWSVNGFDTGLDASLGDWQHIALVKNGTTVTLYRNGVAGTSTTHSTAVGTSGSLAIMAGVADGTQAADGYMSNFRIVKGTAVYTAAFTPPSSPVTAITNTSLLTNFTNAAIFDSTADNDLETVGNAQVSTSVKKFGTGSMAFDGSGDYLFTPLKPELGYGTGDFTIEFWAYPNNSTGVQVIVDQRAGSANRTAPTIYLNGGALRYYTDNADRITGGSVSASQWSHIALSRSGSSTRLFINGTQTGSTITDTRNYIDSPLYIGEASDGVGGAAFNGYIDDLRITKGVARYTANFTPPTAPFPDQ